MKKLPIFSQKPGSFILSPSFDAQSCAWLMTESQSILASLNIEAMIADLKKQLADGRLKDESQIKDAIKEAAKDCRQASCLSSPRMPLVYLQVLPFRK